MSILDFYKDIILTKDQEEALGKVSSFLAGDDDVFILKGYAGTGKTLLLKGIVEYINSIDKPVQLMAPTGRAAKVINLKTGHNATTIHKGIYSYDKLLDSSELENGNEQPDYSDTDFIYYYKLAVNENAHHSVIIVDEASMISNKFSQQDFYRFGSGCILNDLITYSDIQSLTSTSKLIFIGDPAQLPPVNMNFSPALDSEYLSQTFNLKIVSVEMKEIKRQGENTNAILDMATNLRKSITSGFYSNFRSPKDAHNIQNILPEQYNDIYKKTLPSKLIIAYKNKTVFDLNNSIRLEKYGSDLPIQEGDHVIIGGNNYLHGVMNGEFAVVARAEENTVSRIVNFRIKKGETLSVTLIWRKVELLISGNNTHSTAISAYILENYLNGEDELENMERRALYIDFKNRHPFLKPNTIEFKDALTKDEFANCLLLKYGYAVTCHKAQGGEWENVLVYWDYITGLTNSNFFRWAYTAITRSRNKLINISPPYFDNYSKMSKVNISVIDSYYELTGDSLIPQEIVLSGEVIDKIKLLGLNEFSDEIRHHFAKVWLIAKKNGIEIENWSKNAYEIRYIFKREVQQAAIMFWINGKNEFRKNYSNIPRLTTSEALFNEISLHLNELDTVIVIDEPGLNTQTITNYTFDKNIEEEKPFLWELYNDLIENCKSRNINISDIYHHEFRDRYLFKRFNEEAVIDFEYGKLGFFGRVLPIATKCNSSKLIQDIFSVIENLKAN